MFLILQFSAEINSIEHIFLTLLAFLFVCFIFVTSFHVSLVGLILHVVENDLVLTLWPPPPKCWNYRHVPLNPVLCCPGDQPPTYIPRPTFKNRFMLKGNLQPLKIKIHPSEKSAKQMTIQLLFHFFLQG